VSRPDRLAILADIARNGAERTDLDEVPTVRASCGGWTWT
jgi:hypothetical protein